MWVLGMAVKGVPPPFVDVKLHPITSTLTVRVLDAELEPLLLSKAAQFNLPGAWVSRLDRLDPERRQVQHMGDSVGLYLNPCT